MNVVIKDIEIDAKTPVVFIPLSDIHVGHMDFDISYFKKTVAWIKEKGALTFFGGDMIDAIGRTDKRFEVDSVDPFFLPYLDSMYEKQTEVFIDLVTPIKDQIISVLPGNHECSVKKWNSFPVVANIAKALDIPISTDPGYIILRFHNNTSIMCVKIWVSHGTFLGGRLLGGKVNNLLKVGQSFPGNDIYLAGHTHDKWMIEQYPSRLTAKFNIEEKRCFFANTGGFLRTYQEKDTDTWASRSVFTPQVPGCVRFDFYLKRKNGQRYIDIHGRV